MKVSRCSYLLEKYKNGLCTVAERRELLELLSLPETEDWLKQEVDKEILAAEFIESFSEGLSKNEADDIFETIVSKDIQEAEVVPANVRRMYWLRYAAAIVLIIGVGGFFIWKNTDFGSSDKQHLPVAMLDIDPGTTGAVLTLADGSTMILDSLQDGVIAKENGALAVLKAGELNYNVAGDASDATSFNTITTPKGRQFNLVLADGTKVWLNAGSSLKYPTVFKGNERRVTVSGEAYFEVAHNKALPFFVNVENKAEVKVLGTHFNINAYTDEKSINTTLLEGAVLVKKYKSGKIDNNAGVVLKPGTQAQITEKETIRVVSDVETEQIVAWKNGIFNFDDIGLEDVMRQLERWYNIEVVYEKGIPDIVFWGKMERNLTLSTVLGILERSEVQFKIEEGRKLIVLP
ncbi:FecR family protein [Gynurincola endophyticus]|uniref:FecR family protein n=1 Tax=Gynurincola endophyticus TaxID=2479004 RepID=UPI000F8F8285|nr:FecR family protein [Gynurincola endophyticus]